MHLHWVWATRAKAVAEKVLLLEEFLAKEAMAKRLDLPLRSLGPTTTLVHGHCHQKAVGAMKSMRRVLKLIPDHDFELIEAGCCGMAGTFGLEAEHADMATQLVNLDLMPALENAPEARVVANGFSCRQQMRGHGDDPAAPSGLAASGCPAGAGDLAPSVSALPSPRFSGFTRENGAL